MRKHAATVEATTGEGFWVQYTTRWRRVLRWDGARRRSRVAAPLQYEPRCPGHGALYREVLSPTFMVMILHHRDASTERISHSPGALLRFLPFWRRSAWRSRPRPAQ